MQGKNMPVNVTKVSDMTTKHKHVNPILVTGAAGAVGGIGRNLTEFLLARGYRVRALVRRRFTGARSGGLFHGRGYRVVTKVCSHQPSKH